MKILRHAKMMSQAELAARAGISRKTLVALELHGEGSLATFIRVASALGQSDMFSSMLLFKPRSISELEQEAKLTSLQRVRHKATRSKVHA
jgi:DNA-binding XRE family transcriptional regulator